ncbi:MAG: XrtV sorting system accessory protein [Pseudomonadota bacterium]
MTHYDMLSLALLLVAIALFVKRSVDGEPPVLPYLTIACTCLVSNWLGKAGADFGAISLLTAAAFLFLGCALRPNWRTMSGVGESSAG